MRKEGKVRERRGVWKGLLMLVMAAVIILSADGLSLVSHAQSKGKVTATSAKIRKEPNVQSEMVGSAANGKEITINSQVQGSDGKIWYQVAVNATTVGYIRSDLVEITDGTTPPDGAAGGAPGTASAGTLEEVNPVSATVKGGNAVRIRSEASAAGDNIVATVSNGLVLTVTGRITGSDGKIWYKANYSDNGNEVEGFIREDYVTVSGEVTPYVPPVPEGDAPLEPEGQEPPEPEVTKSYDTMMVDGEWYLLDYDKNAQHRIQDLFDTVANNAKAYEAERAKAARGRVFIIVLVFLLVAAVSGIAVLVLKIKDMSDDAYFNQVERETLRRRGDSRPMHTVGAGQPVSGRPSGAPQGQKPSGSQHGGQGQKPSGSQQGGQGQRPPGSQQGGQGQRPSGSQQGGQGQRPSGSQQGGQGQRQSGSQQGGQGQRTAASGENRQGQNAPHRQGQQGWQSKNFMSEENDEFEFGFLNYNETEEK